ncbi:MAG: sulfite exporter TauE/SafE family protein [Desulfarculus sp.]|nr:sulfite exporter TauE/SafE family protein [Desulfarculus sp.]
MHKPAKMMGLACLVAAFGLIGAVAGLWAEENPNAGTSPGPQPPAASAALTLKVDQVHLDNGGQITVSGQAPAGKPVMLEMWAAARVRASFFDSKPGKDGVIPYKLYLTYEMPAFYRIVLPKDRQAALDEVKAQGKQWSFGEALKKLGAEAAFTQPAQAAIETYQASFLASVIGSRGDLLPKLDDKESRRRAMQLVKTRFRSPGKVFATGVESAPDGSFKAVIQLPEGSAPGDYFVAAVVDQTTRSQPVKLDNAITFPIVYMSNAGTSINLFWPFLLSLAIGTFGVLMGAGGGFILNPLLVSIWPLPHTIVAGTVMPTVLFSQGSGIYNYSKIKFINWKLGVTMGLAMLVGGFIGPKLTELITLDQFKFVFGWILLVLAALMLWQTTPGYLAKNKKEQEVLKQCKLMAEQAAKARKGEAPKC